MSIFRSRPGRLAVAAPIVVLLFAAAGCSTPEESVDDEPTLTVGPSSPEPSTESSSTAPIPTPTPTPTPTAPAGSAIPLDYPEDGVRFTPLPALKGASLGAVKTYVQFERGIRRAYLTGRSTALLKDNGEAELADGIASSARQSFAEGYRYGGPLVVTVSVQGASAEIVGIALCFDSSEQKATGPDAEDFPVRSRAQVLVSKSTGKWRVTDYGPLDGEC